MNRLPIVYRYSIGYANDVESTMTADRKMTAIKVSLSVADLATSLRPVRQTDHNCSDRLRVYPVNAYSDFDSYVFLSSTFLALNRTDLGVD